MAPGNPFGNRITNEIMYMANVLGQGRIPYIAPNSTLKPKPRQAPFTSLSSDQLPAGAYMTEAGRTYGIDSEQVGRLGGYMDERGRIFLPANNQVRPSSWGASSFGRTQPPAAERAYQAEKSRVAQITAQDPELQRYEAARKIAAAPGATPEQVQSAEDIGMQMWAKANPQLAAKVRPGQFGYDAIQGSLAGQAASQGYGYRMPQQMLMTPPPGVNAPQGLPGVSSFGATSTYGQQGLQIDPEMEKKFQALLNQAQK